MFYPYLGIMWLLLAGVLLYKGFSGARQADIQSLSASEAVPQNKRARLWNLGLGSCFLVLAVIYFVFDIR